jgi:hypothetical protein
MSCRVYISQYKSNFVDFFYFFEVTHNEMSTSHIADISLWQLEDVQTLFGDDDRTQFDENCHFLSDSLGTDNSSEKLPSSSEDFELDSTQYSDSKCHFAYTVPKLQFQQQQQYEQTSSCSEHVNNSDYCV